MKSIAQASHGETVLSGGISGEKADVFFWQGAGRRHRIGSSKPITNLKIMDLVFNCPKCQQELEVDAAGAGQEIACPSCGAKIRIPEPAEADDVAVVPQPINAIAASAAAKVEKHLKVPVHDKPPEQLIARAAKPLEVAAKESDRQMRVKCIRHVDCVEVGHDKFDEIVSKFLGKIGEQNVVSITTISYSIVDIASQKLLNDYGVMIVYKG
jgi:transcription elongation factor Elf1